MTLIDLVRKPFIQEFKDAAECGCQPRGGFYLSAENFADEIINRMTTLELLEAISTALAEAQAKEQS